VDSEQNVKIGVSCKKRVGALMKFAKAGMLYIDNVERVRADVSAGACWLAATISQAWLAKISRRLVSERKLTTTGAK
jgi:hypothetical protein